MVSPREQSFINQTVSYHASGGDLDALIVVSFAAPNAVHIEEPELSGATRLYTAARFGWCSALSWLLERGADIHSGRTVAGLMPLQIAASQGHIDAAVLLLDAGARVEDRDSGEWTALHFAAGCSDPTMCRLLVSRGASLDARSDQGRDPEARARHRGNTTTADFLAAVRAAGGWLPWLNVPRKELLALRQQLPTLRDRGRAAPASSVRAHERLFLKTPDDVFSHVLAFWRSDRDD